VVMLPSSTLLAPNLAAPDKLTVTLLVLHHHLCLVSPPTAEKVAPVTPLAVGVAPPPHRAYDPRLEIICAVVRAWLDVDQGLLVDW